jgi:FkbM family methyltransferase
VRLVALQYKTFELELRHLHDFVPTQRIAIDIGTWWGPWSWWLCRLVPRVEAFEPNHAICAELQHILPDNVTLHNVAVSDRRGHSTLWSPGLGLGTEGRSTLIAEGHPGWAKQEVEVVPLDDFRFTNVGFVKIDVEGYEFAVLRGASALLDRERPNVMLEIEQAHQHTGDHVHDVTEFMRIAGYAGYFLAGSTWQELAGMDWEAARRRGRRQQSMGLLRSALARERYINNFLFMPTEKGRPGSSPAI